MLRNFVDAVNSIHANVYGFILILVGSGLCFANIDIGKELVVGGFALITGSKLTEAQQAK